MDLLIEPLQFAFFRNALLAAVLVGALCGLMGVFIVLRGMSYIGHGLAHAAFGGAVAGYLLKLNFHLAAAAGALLAVVLVDRVSDGRRLRADAAIGIVTTALFALGAALASAGGRFGRSVEAALFGNILGVTASDLTLIAAVALLCLVAVFICYRQIFFLVFDEEAAAVFGIARRRVRWILAATTALTVVASMNLVGVTMIAATLVIPAASLRMLSDSYHRIVLLAPPLGAAIGVLGLFLSYALDAAPGATIVLVGAAVFALCWGLRHFRDRYHFHAHAHRHGGVVHVHPHSHQGEHAHDHAEAGHAAPGHDHPRDPP